MLPRLGSLWGLKSSIVSVLRRELHRHLKVQTEATGNFLFFDCPRRLEGACLLIVPDVAFPCGVFLRASSGLLQAPVGIGLELCSFRRPQGGHSTPAHAASACIYPQVLRTHSPAVQLLDG